MDKKGVCVLSTGGTGGHVLPCTALATELNAIGWEVIIFTDVRGLQYLDKSSNEYSIEVLKISSETASLRKKIHRAILSITSWGFALRETYV